MSDNTSQVVIVFILCAALTTCGVSLKNRIARVAEAEAQMARGEQ